MIVLDTHAWLWWVDSPERLGPGARDAIDAAERVGVSPISVWELALLTERGRIKLDRAIIAWVRQALAHARCAVLELTPEVAVRAASLPQASFPGDPADRLIYATAITIGAPLVSRDRELAAFDPARTIWD